MSSLNDHCEFNLYLAKGKKKNKFNETSKKTFFQNDILSTIPMNTVGDTVFNFKKSSLKYKTKSLSKIPVNTSTKLKNSFRSFFKNNYIYTPDNIIRLESKFRVTKNFKLPQSLY